MKYVWTFRRISFELCLKRQNEMPHEAIQEFVVQGKDFIDMVMPPFQNRCRFCKTTMPGEGKWQVSTEEVSRG
jgi:hypothetical protein